MKSLIEVLLESGALRFGSFTLKDGSASPFFINLGDVASGEHLAALGEHFADAVLRHYPDVTSVFGPAYKGFTLATATAIALTRRGRNVGVFFDRKEAKAHGEGGMFFGRLPKPSDCIVVLDDVTTSGATKVDAFAKIESTFGVRPSGVLVAVDRRRAPQPLPFTMHALVSLADVASYLKHEGRPEASVLTHYLESTV